MVVANYSTLIEDERQQLQDVAIDNFCPRLIEAVRILSQHKVGPLQQQVQLSNFQSSSTCSLPIDDSISNVQSTRNNMFVLALPFLCEETLPESNDNMVQWLIITHCNRPDIAPEVILLGLDNFSYLRANQRAQRHQNQTYQITQECYWQQYVASDSFQLQCLTKWDKINEDSFLSQFCLLANQLYDCYNNFQLYKLKMSLKSTSPPVQLVQAYTQFKQLSRSAVIEIDTVTTYIDVELCVDVETSMNTLGYENLFNQKHSLTPSVRMRAIISMKSMSTEITEHDDYKIQLASVTGNFPSNNIYGISKISNKEYSVRILNPKLNPKMLSLALDSTTPIDFALYVFKVQQASIDLYNCDSTSSVYDSSSEESTDGNPMQLVFDALHREFCDALPDNYLIDYQINDSNTFMQNTKNFIRFLLVDNGDDISETSQLKYILTIEFNEEVEEESETILRLNNVIPIITLRPVYDDESPEQNLNVDVGEIKIEADTDWIKYNNKMAKIIKTVILNNMRTLRCKAVEPILTRYYNEWSPSDSYYLGSLTKPPPYKLS